MGDTMSGTIAITTQNPTDTKSRQITDTCKSIFRAVEMSILLLVPSQKEDYNSTSLLRRDEPLECSFIENECHLRLIPRPLNSEMHRPDLRFEISAEGTHFYGLLRYTGNDAYLMQWIWKYNHYSDTALETKGVRAAQLAPVMFKVDNPLPQSLRFEEVKKAEANGGVKMTSEIAAWFVKNAKNDIFNPEAVPIRHRPYIDDLVLFGPLVRSTSARTA
jgi:hypothetical protein